MNLSMLSDEELLRIAQPSTDLERLLIERLTEAADEVESALEEVRACGPAWEEEMCVDCGIKEKDIGVLNKRIEYLEAQLDEHKIKYEK